MLSSFNLNPGTDIDSFTKSLHRLDQLLRNEGLIQSTGAVGRRQRHEVMDTDDRDHEYFFVMSFKDRAQCDLSVAVIYEGQEPLKSIHHAVWSMVSQPVFTCWEDI